MQFLYIYIYQYSRTYGFETLLTNFLWPCRQWGPRRFYNMDSYCFNFVSSISTIRLYNYFISQSELSLSEGRIDKELIRIFLEKKSPWEFHLFIILWTLPEGHFKCSSVFVLAFNGRCGFQRSQNGIMTDPTISLYQL